MRTVVFDLDGTLADTSGDLIAAGNGCFAALGLGAPLNAASDVLTAFAGGRAMLRLGAGRLGLDWTEAEVDAQYPVLLQAYADAIDTHTKLYPGAVAAVQSLRRAGFATAICTNKPEGLAQTLTRSLGIRDLFDALIGADTLPTRKPDAAPYLAAVSRAGGALTRSLLLGDTITDVDTARAAGVPVALVTFGPEGTAVTRFSPDAVLAHFDLLPALADRMLPQR
ncbi:MAG: HAD-IA family hydrolase [Paracoccaceae bacterium]|nr:HAD-IA family hydrolase [Paracoccaceae bacterium]